MAISQEDGMPLLALAALPVACRMSPIQEVKSIIRWLQAQATLPEEGEMTTPITGLMTLPAHLISTTADPHSLAEDSPMAEDYVEVVFLMVAVHVAVAAISEEDGKF